MKKTVSIILCIFMLMAALSVSADVPSFLKSTQTNYTMDYSIEVSFGSGEELRALLDEISGLEQIQYFVDLPLLIESAISEKQDLKLKADISEDFKKIKMSLTGEAENSISMNSNLDVNLSARYGMWADIDITDEENPVFRTVLSLPVFDKYMEMDFTELTGEEEMSEFIRIMKAVFDKEKLESLSAKSAELIYNNSVVTRKGNDYKMFIDNEAFIKILDETFALSNEYAKEIYDYSEDIILPDLSFDGLKLLGNRGLQYDFSIKGGKIKSADVFADIELNIKDIYEAITSQQWQYVSDGKIDIEVKMTAGYTNEGRTVVEFPTLTEENSFSPADMMPAPEYNEYDYDYDSYYPYYWASGNMNEIIPAAEGYYVPLRQTLEYAYDDTVTIDYNNGVVNVYSDILTSFVPFSVTVGSDYLTSNGMQYSIGEVIVKDASVYISSAAFEKLYGWRLVCLTRDYITGEVFYEFETGQYDW